MTAASKKRILVFASPLSHRETMVREISAGLLEAGIRVFPPAFPFGMHHDHYRTKLRPNGRHIRRGDVAALLDLWSRTRENPDDYVWQAVCGGLLPHFADAPAHREKLTAEVAGRMEVLGWGSDFLEWASDEISRPAKAFARSQVPRSLVLDDGP